jgi:hypothetical protein
MLEHGILPVSPDRLLGNARRMLVYLREIGLAD